jgi:hypothetical protein
VRKEPSVKVLKMKFFKIVFLAFVCAVVIESTFGDESEKGK